MNRRGFLKFLAAAPVVAFVGLPKALPQAETYSLGSAIVGLPPAIIGTPNRFLEGTAYAEVSNATGTAFLRAMDEHDALYAHLFSKWDEGIISIADFNREYLRRV